MGYKKNYILSLLEIGNALIGEKDRNKLFDMILNRSIEVETCDSGNWEGFVGEPIRWLHTCKSLEGSWYTSYNRVLEDIVPSQGDCPARHYIRKDEKRG